MRLGLCLVCVVAAVVAVTAQAPCPTLPGEVVNGATKAVVSTGTSATLAARAAALLAQGWSVLAIGGSASNPSILASCPVGKPPTAGIAASYPKDVGISAHPAVVFVEEFEDSISGVISRWTDHLEHTAAISLDVPAGSAAGSHSIAIPRTAADSGGHFLKSWPTNYDRLYVRFYIKATSTPHHSGVWLGGENVAGGPRYPDPHAGVQPCRVVTGECTAQGRAAWFWASAEQSPYNYFDSYASFLTMHPDAGGTYWGNLLTGNTANSIPLNTWTCVEHTIKVNDIGDSNGEYTVWLNGLKVTDLRKGTPTGTWSGGIFTQGAGTPFPGLEWRDAAFGVNYIWLQNYTDGAATNTVWYDHVVVATQYIGCLAP